MDVLYFQNKRKKMLVLNLAYFAAMLAIGIFLFLTGAGRWIYIPAAAAVLFYLLAARPAKKKYEAELREAILRRSVMGSLRDAAYEPKKSISMSYLTDAGFVTALDPRAFLSREYISGTSRGLKAELADVTFPFREDGLNKMWSGCLIHIESGSGTYEPLKIWRGDTSGLKAGREKKLVDKLGSYIPGSLSLSREGNTLDILLRGRFIGFVINPLGEVNETVLSSDPLPELKTALELAEIRRNIV